MPLQRQKNILTDKISQFCDVLSHGQQASSPSFEYIPYLKPDLREMLARIKLYETSCLCYIRVNV